MSPFLHQYRLPPVPVPGAVAVDGSAPDGLAVVWLPRTAVGEGTEPDGDGEAEAGLLDGAADVDAGPDCAAEDEGDTATVDGEDGVVADGEDGVVADGDEPVELADGLRLAGLAGGRSAIDPVDDATNTAAPSATSPATRAIGTRPILRPTGRTSRQLGQKPETGVAR